MSSPHEYKLFPSAPSLRQLIGPSFLILALGLGSGEVILWPYLAANHGLGIAWAAVIGITFQYFINMEIERYALVKGESVFVGIGHLWKFVPIWFIFSTFIGFGLPGIISASAHVVAFLVGIQDARWIAIPMLLLIGMILSVGRTVYGVMETLTKTIILAGVPFIFLLAVVMARSVDWTALAHGLVGFASGNHLIPEGVSLATFLAAFAYSGAGGNLNLTQSIYVREKGYGMALYAQKMAGLFTAKGTSAHIRLDGTFFEDSTSTQTNFRTWWRRVSVEHAVVFWFTGALSILMLMLLSYTAVHGSPHNAQGIQFVLNEGMAISARLGTWVGIGFLIAVGIMLFQTQLGVMDSTSRIMSENLAVMYTRITGKQKVRLSRTYFSFLWAQIAFGIMLFLLGQTEPKTLLILGACLNAVAMFVHIGLVSVLNRRTLPRAYQPPLWRQILLWTIFVFFGVFSIVVFADQILK
ncbi:MAG: hypothetical protein UU48_C0004G0051 [Candidatus Uhrbacteria bacterium GW2011_GWF2_41_16]|uniref:Uncharacterized protein n=1 Tax=Candidatus Uhrbacteria bacterium GW2011_GWF2_41_16 TaxID=1618997 RepID=A0A0G0VBG1_9BACT|nr:MAG: hypothetical protein UU48_C0004G0051 [Candidatus Uhrbacteria bacterium GW2011_GWF2_41_16]HBP00418.1 hypothetical protein [Candidatus Uhrbacteria bacterium]